MEHGLVATADLVQFQAATDQTVPARVEVPIAAHRPVCGLEEDHRPRVRLGPIYEGSRVHNILQVFQMVDLDANMQCMAGAPVSHTEPTADSGQPITNKIWQPCESGRAEV